MRPFAWILALVAGCALPALAAEHGNPAPARHTLYPGNRAPLVGKPYTELPLDAIEARGWLREMLRRQAAGMTGRLDELYPEVVGPRNGWLGGQGDAWERGPYWIDGLYPLACLLRDDALKAKALAWVNWTIDNQRADGYIGPRPTPTPPAPEPGLQRDNQEDWWPRMVMLKILQQHHQATGDPRVIATLRKYFEYQWRMLPHNPLDRWTWWGKQRGGDNLMVILWLYNLTGERWLLDLADLVHKQTLPYTEIFLDGRRIAMERLRFGVRGDQDGFHGVNLAQGFKTPLIRFQQDGDPRHLEATRRAFQIIDTIHGQPHGLYVADEGMHGRDLTGGSELCTAVELMFSLEKMLEITGQIEFADRLEKIAFNALPTQVSPDALARQYYQQTNQVQVTTGDRNFVEKQGGQGIVYGLLSGYPCCTCNWHQGWPKFAHHLWMASADNGLAALVYAPSQVKARVADGSSVTILEETNYPFDDVIRFTIQCDKTLAFPLHLRIPHWCPIADIRINGEAHSKPRAGEIALVHRAWQTGDQLELRFSMPLRPSYWQDSSVALERGPLLYALRIEGEWSETPRGNLRAIRECKPKQPWNYALLGSAIARPDQGFEIVRKTEVADFPWTLEAAPLELKTRAIRLPRWQLDNDSAGRVPNSPASAPRDAPIETIRLVPYGCTTLRVAGFPWIQDRPRR